MSSYVSILCFKIYKVFQSFKKLFLKYPQSHKLEKIDGNLFGCESFILGCGTKQPILKREKQPISKTGKIVNFDYKTKQPI